jgi:OmpA-OmpF porin, OOP family
MRTLPALLALCAVLSPLGAVAQDLSDDELLKLFQAQRDAYKAAVSGNKGLTRGLTLVTADDVEVASEDTTTETATTETASTETTETTGNDVTVASTTEDPVADPTAEGSTVLVKVPEDLQVNVRIEFEFDSAALTDEQKPKLRQLCNVMRDADIQLFRIVGHTDSSGTDDYNERLSLLRAKEVQRYFISDCGISADRLEAVGLGERFILDGTDPKSDDNRRVEFQALS